MADRLQLRSTNCQSILEVIIALGHHFHLFGIYLHAILSGDRVKNLHQLGKFGITSCHNVNIISISQIWYVPTTNTYSAGDTILTVLGRSWIVWVTVSSLGRLQWLDETSYPLHLGTSLHCLLVCIARISMWSICHQIQTGTLYATGLHAILSQMPFEIYKGMVYLQFVLAVFLRVHGGWKFFQSYFYFSETSLFFCNDFFYSYL